MYFCELDCLSNLLYLLYAGGGVVPSAPFSLNIVKNYDMFPQNAGYATLIPEIFMTCLDINEIKDHLCCEIELDEYTDGHISVECVSCGKVLFEIYPLILPKKIAQKIKRKESNGRKNYHISR